MANREDYKSIWTGEQIDDAVSFIRNGTTPFDQLQNYSGLNQNSVMQILGPSDKKVVSQAAITSIVTQLQKQMKKIEESVFVFTQTLFGTKIDDNTAALIDVAPVASPNNIIILSNTTNTDYDWTTPSISLTHNLIREISLSSNSVFNLYLPFRINRNANISWGAKVKVSTNQGASYSYISTNQAFGAVAYDANVGNTAELQIYTDLLTSSTEYSSGTIFIIELFKKQTLADALTTSLYFGVEIDNAKINTYATFGVESISVDTEQIADGAITLQKLSSELQNTISSIDSKVPLRTNSTGTTEVYAYNNDTQGSVAVSTSPSNGKIAAYNSNGNLKSSTPVDNNDCATKGYVTGLFSLDGTTLTITTT